MYLGIDLGTSSVKIILMDAEQNILAQASSDLSVQRPHPLWSEQYPEAWWQGTCHAMRTLQNSHEVALSQVEAIGLSGQQHGATLLDKAGRVLRPAMLWNDGRSMAQCEQLEAKVPDFASITGNRVMPGFTAPKVLWVAQHEPEIFAKTDKVLLPKDYLRFRMTGTYASDMSDASGTSWLNVGARDWSKEMLQATGLTLAHMPELFEGTAPTAILTKQVAKEWGLADNVIVAAGAGDHAAAAMSINVTHPGDGFLSLGTSGTYFVADDVFAPNANAGVHTFCHCVPKLWHQMNCHLSAASALSWWADVCEVKVLDLLSDTESNEMQKDTAYFLPYLSGERSPHNNPYAKGAFIGLTHDSSRSRLTQAVLEGVALNFAQGQRAMLDTGTKIKQIAVVGGGAKSVYWGKILAAALGQSLTLYKDRDVGAAYGAARLGFLAKTGLDVDSLPLSTIEQVLEPNPEWQSILQAKLPIFMTLYDQLKFMFTEEKQS